jgi:hypothetical protein
MSAESYQHPAKVLPSSLSEPDAALRRSARAFTATAGSRLRLAAGRAGGEAGLAVACALIDMIDDDHDPAGWPVAEVIALLRGEAARDRQVARLLVDLGEIEDLVAALSPDPDEEEETVRRPAA